MRVTRDVQKDVGKDGEIESLTPKLRLSMLSLPV